MDIRFFKMLFCLLFLAGLIFTVTPSYASELDEQCANECKNSGFEEGHYLPPEPGAACEEGFEKHPTDEICCCK